MTLNFPKIPPTGRAFTPGDFANTKYRANSGAEFRIQYGSKPTGMKMQLQYANITDAQAEEFLDHFYQQSGTFKSFVFVDGDKGAKAGWKGDMDAIGVQAYDSEWRYESAPQLQSIYPGVSTVTVNLIAATKTTQSAVCDDS